jgi:ferredoxin-like protein FixX
MTTKSVAEALLELGFNLQAIFRFEQLPGAVRREITRHEPASARFQNLILLASGGSMFWPIMKQDPGVKMDQPDPVDNYTIRALGNFFGNDAIIVYPTNRLIPLQALGKLAGWHYDSPLGLGIHPVFGLWFAYRAVIMSRADFTPLASELDVQTGPPCQSCRDKPCINACPASAAVKSGFKVQLCSDYRMEPDSSCHSRCISRLACPVGRDHRYLPEQMAYHYGHSLAAIRRNRGS